ncbi:MAG TPA: hypothetical protein PLV83_06120, partial [Bacilli bacterium]|nr:hypothetical protein [Bacilli bacterium]
INAAETKCQLRQVKGETITTSYDFSDSDINTKMNVKGKLPTSGTLTLNNECSVTAVNASDGTFTATLNNGKVEIANGG